jgi:hypothetical protein
MEETRHMESRGFYWEASVIGKRGKELHFV